MQWHGIIVVVSNQQQIGYLMNAIYQQAALPVPTIWLPKANRVFCGVLYCSILWDQLFQSCPFTECVKTSSYSYVCSPTHQFNYYFSFLTIHRRQFGKVENPQ